MNHNTSENKMIYHVTTGINKKIHRGKIVKYQLTVDTQLTIRKLGPNVRWQKNNPKQVVFWVGFKNPTFEPIDRFKLII